VSIGVCYTLLVSIGVERCAWLYNRGCTVGVSDGGLEDLWVLISNDDGTPSVVFPGGYDATGSAFYTVDGFDSESPFLDLVRTLGIHSLACTDNKATLFPLGLCPVYN